MAASNVPKFGNWDNEDNVPYTLYFEKARKNKGGKMINPNDPQENPEMFQTKAPSTAAAAPSKPKFQPEERLEKRQAGKEHGDLQQNLASSPARGDNIDRRRRNSDSVNKPARQSAGSDRSFDKSPLHPKAAREGKHSYDSSHGTPGRSYGNNRGSATPGRRLQKPESPDRGAAVPKFGEWDEKNPQSADNYTYIFNKVRDERHVDSSNPSRTPTRPSSNTIDHRDEKFQKRCCPWF